MSILFISFGFSFVWSFLGLLVWSCLQTTLQGFTYLQRLHRIPCSRCTFCTGDYRLKCTVNTYLALSEDAIGCRDFEPSRLERFSMNNYQ
ncbi:MAG: hypothetical protein AB4290_31295 [Spirulina sp.]